MDSLFSLAHRLLTYGLDGSPIYVDEFTRLNPVSYTHLTLPTIA